MNFDLSVNPDQCRLISTTTFFPLIFLYHILWKMYPSRFFTISLQIKFSNVLLFSFEFFSNDPYCLTKKVLFLLEGYSFLLLYWFIFLSFVYFFFLFETLPSIKKLNLFRFFCFSFILFPLSYGFYLLIFSISFFLNSFSLPLLSLDFLNNNFPSLLYQKKLFNLSLFTMMRYLCPPCVHPFVHLLSLLSLSSRFLFSIAFDSFVFLLLSLSMTFFSNMFLGFLQFFVCVPFCWAFLHISVFLLVSHFFLFKTVSIFVFILLCFWTFSFFVSFLEHFYFLCVSLFNIVYFFECISFLKIGWSSFFCPFLIFSFLHIHLFFKRENKTCYRFYSLFWNKKRCCSAVSLFFFFKEIFLDVFSFFLFFYPLEKTFLLKICVCSFWNVLFYLHFFSHQKYVQHFPFRNVSFTSLIPPFVHPLSTCSFFLFLRVFLFLSPIFRPTQKFPCLLVSLCFLYL